MAYLWLVLGEDSSGEKHRRGRHHAAASCVDDAIAALCAGLRCHGIDRETIVVFTSDHGESLYEENRGQGHGDHLFGDEGTHVPLIVADPRRAPRRITDVVRDVDVTPTLCELAGIAGPEMADGRSLVPLMDGQNLPGECAFAETEIWFANPTPAVPAHFRADYPGLSHLAELDPDHDDDLVIREEFEETVIAAKHRMVRDDRYKLVFVPTDDHPKWFLFDTWNDPDERTNIYSDEPDVASRLKETLLEWMRGERRATGATA